MDPLVARIMMSIVFWPVAIVLWASSCALMIHQSLDETWGMLWAFVVVGFFEVTWFMLLWRRHICWNDRKKRNTWLSFPAAVVLGIVLTSPARWLSPFDRTPWILLAGGATLALWPVIVVLVWRDRDSSPRASGKTVTCSECGYDMRGLTECRCPECGRQYTIDQLLAAQSQSLASPVTGLPLK